MLLFSRRSTASFRVPNEGHGFRFDPVDLLRELMESDALFLHILRP